MKVNWNMIVVVLFLGVAVGGLVVLHCDLNNIRDDLAALHQEVGSVDARLSGFEADMDNMNSVVPPVVASLTADLSAIKTDVDTIQVDLNYIRQNGLP
jgi:hypothetical protein